VRIGIEGSRVILREGGRSAVVADLSGIGALRGMHNAENACAAAAALLLLPDPLTKEQIAAGMRSFPGLAHRMEEIGRQGRTLFVNDSKATNADSTEKALLSFPGDIYWILGGKPKAGGIASLSEDFARVVKAYLIGEATEAFAATLDGAVPFERCGTLDVAVGAAARDAAASPAPEPVVLLSPACASFDQACSRGARRRLPRCQLSRRFDIALEDRMRVSRADRSRVADWWFTVDHVLVGAILAIIGAGLVLSLAASPAVAIKKGLPTYYFVERHLLFSAAGVLIMLAVSLFSPRGVRRFALPLFLLSFGGMIAVHFLGPEIHGARRWLSLGGHSIQPSEFVKPAFVILSAWLFAESETRKDMPAVPLSVLMAVLLATFLLAEPDVGQTLLITVVWGALFYLSGQALLGAGIIGACGAMGLVFAYSSFDHVASRIDRFLAPTPGDNSQLDRAITSFSEGGFLGRGPGEGTIKTVLPDAHTDFIFAVVAEEYGVIACLALVGLFAFVVMRALVKAAQEPDPATRLSIQGLALMFGLQALINMGVNVGLLPAKGITLPFVSSGGSSMLAVSITLGMLPLTRRRMPHA
jgi:cell division protein FtsW